MTSSAELLRRLREDSCGRLNARLHGLTDEEYRWEPVPDCWNVRPSSDSSSGWTVDYSQVHPSTPPLTTIAWRMLHIADGNSTYWEHSFGPAERNFWDLPPHGDAAGAMDYLTASQVPITTSLAELDDEGLDALRPTHFGKAWPTGRILSVLLTEQVHHGAEIGLLRDLYRCLRKP
jgi:DinB superfamily